MSDIFNDNEFIDIEINYTVDKNKSGVGQAVIIDNDKAAKMKADPATKDKVKTLRTQWKPLTWQASNDLLSRATVYNSHTQQQDIDYTKFRDAKLKSCLVGWDAKNDKGESIPCVEATINKLYINIALALLAKYDDAITVPVEDQTKN